MLPAISTTKLATSNGGCTESDRMHIMITPESEADNEMIEAELHQLQTEKKTRGEQIARLQQEIVATKLYTKSIYEKIDKDRIQTDAAAARAELHNQATEQLVLPEESDKMWTFSLLSTLTLEDLTKLDVSDKTLLHMLPPPMDGVQHTIGEVIGFNKNIHKSIRAKVRTACNIPRKPKKAICMTCREKLGAIDK